MSVAGAQLRAFVERVERIEAEIKDLNSDKSEIYKEIRSAGFDVKTVRKIVAARKVDDADRQEQDALFDLYWQEIHGPSRVHVHEGQEFDPETGEVESRAKASEDNGATGQGADAELTDCMAGEVSRVDAGRTASATSERMDATSPGGENPAPIPEPFEPPAFLAKDYGPLRPFCLRPESCGGYGANHCRSCLKARDDATVPA